MKINKLIALLLLIGIFISVIGCSKSNTKENTPSKPNKTTADDVYNVPSEILSLDKKMANYFDISLFDEENYSDIYLGKKFKYDISYNDKKITVPTTIKKLAESGFIIQEGSEYDANSYIFAKETVTLKFADSNSSFTALFYNLTNSSIHLDKCNITKIRLENNLNTKNIVHFNVNGINNDSTVNDVISTLGIPSHFYAIDEENYYFDYFISEDDRRNKIRVFVDLINDCVTAIEVSYYK